MQKWESSSPFMSFVINLQRSMFDVFVVPYFLTTEAPRARSGGVQPSMLDVRCSTFKVPQPPPHSWFFLHHKARSFSSSNWPCRRGPLSWTCCRKQSSLLDLPPWVQACYSYPGRKKKRSARIWNDDRAEPLLLFYKLVLLVVKLRLSYLLGISNII